MTHNPNKKPTKLGKERLLKLADFLENEITNPQFNISEWHSDTTNVADFESGPEITCGTVACALGWAALSPKFKGLKLILEWDQFMPVLRADNSVKDFEAGAVYFGITVEQSEYLFNFGYGYPSDNPRPATVAKVIRNFVNANGIANKRWINRHV